MKLIAFFIFSILSFRVTAQNYDLVDSLAERICESITSSKEENDSIRVFKSFGKVFAPSLSNLTRNQKDSIGDKIYFRLQRNCIVFKELLQRNSPENKYWRTVYEKPKSKISLNEYLEFKKYERYRYMETNGDTVNLEIHNGFWIDHFKDGTYSKLKISWGSECFFDIEFIESNNVKRKNFSNRGDKYRYTILEKSDTYYLMSVEIAGIKRFSIFKLYH